MRVNQPLRVPTLFATLAFLVLSPPSVMSKDAEKESAKPKESEAAQGKKSKKPKRQKKQPVSPKDYAQWEYLSSAKLSEDGHWFLYTVSRIDKESTLHLLDLKAEDKSAPAASYKQGASPRFSNDSNWLAVTIGKSPAEIKKARKANQGKPAPSSGSTIKLRRLKDGETTEIKSVRSFSFSDNSQFAAFEVSGKPSGQPSSPTRALIVRDLKKGSDTTFGNVTKYAWSDQDSLLAMVVDSPNISNSLQLYDPRRGTLRTLDSSELDYANLTWRKDAMDLVVTRQMKHEAKEDVSHTLLAWRNLDKGKSRGKKAAMIFDHPKDDDFPADMFIASNSAAWTKDGKGVLVNLKNWDKQPKALKKEEPKKETEEGTKKDGAKPAPPAEKKPAKPDEKPCPEEETPPASAKEEAKPAPPAEKKPAKPGEKSAPKKPTPPPAAKPLRETLDTDSNVEVWHAKDVDIMPAQKRMAGALKNRNRKAIWWPEDGRLVVLENDLTEKVEVMRDSRLAIGLDETPHEETAMFGPNLSDVFLIDTASGKSETALKKIEFLLKPSPDGEWLLFVRKGNIWSYHVESGKKRNLTAKLKGSFTNQQDDSLAKEKKPYSSGLWLADASGVLLYDRFNVWLIAPDGSAARKLTDGNKEMIRHRVSAASMTREDDGLFDPAKPLYLELYGERSKKAGYARMSIGDAEATSLPEVLIWENRMVRSLTRAEKNDQVFTLQKGSYRDSPDLFVAGPDLADPVQLSKTNPFQKDFLWGRAKLINYVNDNGVKLQGALVYPAGYKKGKKYPMVTYIYERLSQNLHNYTPPSETHPYNPSVFSAEGYFVFMPDIVYRPQEPGPSAVECLVPAVKAVIDTGMVDPDRVALIGHSWGAYQTAFTVTRSDIFAAGVAGAPLTDMMSMSMQVYWNSGSTNARIFHISQGRMDKPFWQDVDNYVRNSPIHGMDSLNTPLLVAFGDKDGAVDFSQGVEMYNAARLAKKENFVMLVYPGENHGLGREENRVDYHYRIIEWLAHYLKKDDAPKWITEGQSFIERQKEIEDNKKARAEKK